MWLIFATLFTHTYVVPRDIKIVTLAEAGSNLDPNNLDLL